MYLVEEDLTYLTTVTPCKNPSMGQTVLKNIFSQTKGTKRSSVPEEICLRILYSVVGTEAQDRN